jgi:signal transduction histidine kinase
MAVTTSKTSELLNIALALNAGRTVTELVDHLFESLDPLLPFDRIGVALLEPDDVLRSHYVRSKLPLLWDVGANARLADTSLGPIVRERQIRVINDLEAYVAEHPQSKTAPLLLAEGMRASLTVPLGSAAGPLGLMFFSSHLICAYGEQQVEFVLALAEALAAALERARLTDQLHWANEELKALDQLKADFLNNLSHELRTPLTAIVANAEFLEEYASPVLSQAHRGFVTEIRRGADRLERMLNTLFDFTAIEAGRLLTQKVPVDVGPMLRQLEAEEAPALATAGLGFTMTVKDEPLRVAADPLRLAQALRALLDNARKFTPAPGMVQIRAGREADFVWIEVQDSGIGVAPDDQARVFDTFFQVDGSLSRPYGGAGLGLALARAIVLAHGGTLMLRSAPGIGSIFTVRLPCAAGA